jgi:hypothetical protein
MKDFSVKEPFVCLMFEMSAIKSFKLVIEEISELIDILYALNV